MKISDAIRDYFNEIDATGGEEAVLRRAGEVNSFWEEAIRSVFEKEGVADYLLSHTNAVYIMKEGDEKKLKVYADEALVRSELDNNQEFIKIRLSEKGERITEFRIYPSKGTVKDRHPFSPRAAKETKGKPVNKEELTEADIKVVEEIAEAIEDEAVRSAFEMALAAEKQKNKSR